MKLQTAVAALLVALRVGLTLAMPQSPSKVEDASRAQTMLRAQAHVDSDVNGTAALAAKGHSALKVLQYQNARCKLGASAKLLWYPHITWMHWFFRGSVTRDHNDFYQPHDFIAGRVNSVPCQVTDASVVSLEDPQNVPSNAKPPAITWLAATYKAGPFDFWAYDEAGNHMCRFCLFRESWKVHEEACDIMMKRLAGKEEFDCSYEIDNHLAESNIAYIGHDIPSYWSSNYVWTRVICVLVLLLTCYCFVLCGSSFK